MKIRYPPRLGVLVDFQNVPANVWFVLRGDPTFGPVCELGESREAYASRLTFGQPQFLFEINDHARKSTLGPLSN